MGLFSNSFDDRRKKAKRRPEPAPADAEIRIVDAGPYVVKGNVKLTKQVIVPEGQHYRYETAGEIEHGETFTLCRCGKSKNPPFCDGAHVAAGFKGEEIASRSPYMTRARRQVGPGIDLLDDDRCAFARFCHTEDGNIWEMVRRSDDPRIRERVIRAACDCPTGRLVAVDKETGEPIDEVYEPEIAVLDDPQQEAGGPLFVKGNIPLYAADGERYEIRNRMALCRCGRSDEMPFCDAAHLTFEFWPGVLTDDAGAGPGDLTEKPHEGPDLA